MAKYQYGINGPFSGKVGAVVGCTWKGIPYMRSLPKKRTGKVSEAEKVNRNKFAMAQEWLKPLTPFLRVGFKGYTERVEGFLAAKSYLLKNAILIDEGQLTIDPEKMLVSFGSLLGPENAEISFQEDDTIKFIWKACPAHHVNAQDQTLLLIYCREANESVYQTHGAFRKNGIDELQIPANFKNKHLLIYMAFVSANRLNQSNSIFLGNIYWG
ncbi:hypothetical protein I5M32_11420 [Pedobacter sp. SD-b]|uniref:Uncharacterized protein n=1 Tax=Pedobacter segetis TaxID=2793069 RepID=A0ABS1BL05_9SPHI|nr:DUF6266 family protein [Pedobacter segetis]MBK0383567.1 hypothetical protein [Pedobacter segetis]